MAVKWSRDWIWPLSTKRLQRGANGLIASRHSSQKLSSYSQNFSTKNDMVGHWSGPYHHIRSIFFFSFALLVGLLSRNKNQTRNQTPRNLVLRRRLGHLGGRLLYGWFLGLLCFFSLDDSGGCSCLSICRICGGG